MSVCFLDVSTFQGGGTQVLQNFEGVARKGGGGSSRFRIFLGGLGKKG